MAIESHKPPLIAEQTYSQNLSVRRETANEDRSSYWKFWRGKGTLITVALLVMIGLVFILAALLLETSQPPRKLYISLVEKLGEALLVVGIVDGLLHLPLWKEYFLEQIKDALITDEYLSRLEDGELKMLMLRAFAARHETPAAELSRKGGFADFFFTDIKEYIHSPYRDAVTSSLTFIHTQNGLIRMDDRTTYVCRNAGSKHQGVVRWENEEDEIENVAVEVEYRLPGDGEWKSLVKRKIVSPKNPIDEKIPSEACQDGLLIGINAEYDVSEARFQYLTMSHLSRNITIVFSHPPSYELQLAFFGLKDEQKVVKKCERSATIRYLSWVLPGDGIAWKLVPKKISP